MRPLDSFLAGKRDLALLLLRLLTGWRLIAGSWQYALGIKPISEVTGFFTSLQIPLPGFSSLLSVYIQFICACLLVLGSWTRIAAGLLAINFVVAIIAAHLQDPIEKSFPAWALFAVCLLLFITGAGRFSLAHFSRREKANRSHPRR